MSKIGQIIVVVSIVAALYLLMLVVMPVIVDLSLAANATINASVNASYFPGSTDMLIATPWILWFVPFVIGGIVVVIILKSP